MHFEVLLTDSAERDLLEIIKHVEQHDGTERADHVLQQIEKACDSLSAQPHRGAHPGELENTGIQEYREIFFKPYRIIYRVIPDRVYVLVIADGRRDMQALLMRRLLKMTD